MKFQFGDIIVRRILIHSVIKESALKFYRKRIALLGLKKIDIDKQNFSIYFFSRV